MDNSAVSGAGLLDRLAAILVKMKSVVVGFSGGIDSTLLLKVARQTLGRDGVLAVTAVSPSYPADELRLAGDLAAKIESEHLLIDSREMQNPQYLRNDTQRCYFCKMELFRILEEVRRERGFQTMAYGANRDDFSDIRPGMRAATEAGVRAPLVEAEMGKEEIRFLGRYLDLPNWDKPARACLASRIPFGNRIESESLHQVERAEAFLLEKGFRQVRVRHHGQVARIETDPEGMARFGHPGVRREIANALKTFGFRFVTLDLDGYRQGSLNPAPGSRPAGK